MSWNGFRSLEQDLRLTMATWRTTSPRAIEEPVSFTALSGMVRLWPSYRDGTTRCRRDWTSGGALPLVSWLSSFRRGLGATSPHIFGFCYIDYKGKAPLSPVSFNGA